MNKQILKLAGPNIISNISIPMLGIVDMALMGHLESDAYIGAIALGSLIFNFIYWGLGFLRMGTSGFTAQAWGRNDHPETILVFSRAFFIALVMSLLLLALQKPIEILSFAVLKATVWRVCYSQSSCTVCTRCKPATPITARNLDESLAHIAPCFDIAAAPRDSGIAGAGIHGRAR